MANKHYSLDQLQTLLEDTSEQVHNTLFDQSNSQYFYQNFTNISLKAIKYINHFLNLVNTNQSFGIIIDDILKTLTQSLRQYKSKNIFAQSNYSFETDNNRQQDEIYHFMNTRNTLLPLECLNNYQNERQRMELQEFVQEMQKNGKYHSKQSKRSLILPKESSYLLKIGRKATYDVELKPIKEEILQNNFAIIINQVPKNCDNVQIQTYQQQLIELMPKKCQMDIASQCENLSIYENGLSNLSNGNIKKNNTNIKKNTGKSKKKHNEQNDRVKKAKFSPAKPFHSKQENITSQRQFLQQTKQKQILEFQQKTIESTLSVKTASPFLTICNKQIDISITNTQMVNGNTTNNTTPIASRKKLMTKTYVEIIKSSKKLNTQIMSKENEGFQGIFTEIDKENSILKQQGHSPATQYTNQVQNCRIGPRKLRYQQKKYEQKKQSIKYTDSINENHNETDTKPLSVFDENTQKIPISSVKISQTVSHQNTEQIHIKNQSNSINSPQSLIKRNTLTTLKQAFKSFNPSTHNEPAEISKHLRTSKMNIQSYGDKAKIQKSSYRSNNKSSSFVTVNGGQSYQSLQSQDYLVSRQKTNDMQQVELINRLAEIQKIKQTNKNSLKIEDSNGKPNILHTSHMKNKKNSQENNRNSRQSQGQSSNGNLMVVFSNKNRVVQQNSSKFRPPQCSKSMQNSNIQKQTILPIQQPKQHQQIRHQSLSSKQGQLSTILQANRHQQSLIDQSKLTFLRKDRNTQCRTVEINTRKTIYRQSSEITPIKTSILNVKNALLSNKKKKIVHSASQHSINLQNYEINDFKRKLRSRLYKDKLNDYLGLIQSTHKRFCGEQCTHIQQIFQGKQGEISQQIFRLFKRLK